MAKGHKSSLYPKIAVILLVVAFLLHLIAIGANWWACAPVDQRWEHIGLWRYCTYPYGGGEYCDDFVNIVYGDWLKAAQSFWILGLFAVPAALGLVAIHALVDTFADNMIVAGAAMGVTGFAGLLNLCSICSFGTRFQEYFNNRDAAWHNAGQLDWTFGLACTDTILCFIALGLCVAGITGKDINEKDPY